ncbi:16S rRNA (adenine(1518)-N(6)/adenine(1519)-N(6))-dimethyltransferase RsmA [Cyanobacterium aponinum FACHB-4101]|uniref:16S rRNA (adenine(1518)-N(6)/adenine(1519)-N(6))- dimethyltransferase RsmA n=1 Tax=Cyanobacterium aponinum TaxID=379064 RepID=UPI001681A761|nr:16S rRNA (adenine(1518)-N(6)/adenine(1519)-N(6))-dimethyltransferase RsmA [Cyanobacterium aponinum]MBD2395084.1 16S rRNA (adenine(1518)-N(6)/adenine(1519)-N(6))-dimethyltransferase RsmA [Cyanobacterium aponinum FACHB-4101]
MTIRPRKQFGQHWLKSQKALDTIIFSAELNKSNPQTGTQGDRILEIGPGTGVLTKRLLPLVDKLLAVEIDRDLCKKLVNDYGKTDNFLLLEGDFLELNLPEILQLFPDFLAYNKVVANIPYNITGPIIEKLLGTISKPAEKQLDAIVLLIQKEVGERLTAEPNNKVYGALTLKVQYLADCEIVCTVPARDFYPPPKVDSVVVKITPRNLVNPAKNPAFLDSLIKLGFSSRRKMLKNNLKSLISPEKLNDTLEKLNLNPHARAENLSLEEWINLSNYLTSVGFKNI